MDTMISNTEILNQYIYCNIPFKKSYTKLSEKYFSLLGKRLHGNFINN